MEHHHRGSSIPSDTAFALLMQTYAQAAQRYAVWLVRRSQFLGTPDQDDIYTLGMTKIWRAYFRPGARQHFQPRSQQAEFALIKAALRCVASDLIDQRRREGQSLQLLELDALDSERNDNRYLCDSNDFVASVNLKLDLERFMTEQLADSTLGLVALYLSGNVSRAQLAHYSEGNLRTSEFRLKQKFKAFLCE